MTTVYIDNHHKIAITDTRVTNTEYSAWKVFLRKYFKNIKGKDTFGVIGQKAIYIHDHLLLCSGDTISIQKVMDMLVDGTINDLKPKKDDPSCLCTWVMGEYLIIFGIYNGKFTKKVRFMSKNYRYSFGSGCFTEPMNQLIHANEPYEVDEVIEKFKLVTKFDQYTNSRVNVYQF